MPRNTRELDQQLAEEDGQTAVARAGAISQDIPPAVEPLEGKNLEMLADIVKQAVPVLSGGQVPELELPPMPDGAEAVPPELGVALNTIGAFLQQAGAEVPELANYAFDPAAAMADNAGLLDAAHALAGLMEDQKVLGALVSGAASKRPPSPSEEGAGDEGPDQLSGEG